VSKRDEWLRQLYEQKILTSFETEFYTAQKETLVVVISAKERLHTDELQELLYNAVKLPELSDQDIMVTNMRHYEALKQAHTAIVRVQDGLNDRISGDFLSQDIRECLHYLGEITGQITTDEVLGNIFSKFCIGK
jgi:tRNA modification GTPase